MPVSTIGTNGLTSGLGVTASTLSVNGNNISAVNSLGFRNRIINGDMSIIQRGSQSGLGGTSAYTLDRWLLARENGSQAARFTVSSQALTASDTPLTQDGLVNMLQAQVTTASGGISAGFSNYFAQRIEGFNVADFAWGTPSARPVTVSFWAKTVNRTGTMSVSLFSGSARNYVQTISLTTSWQKFTLTYPGDTGGSILTSDNSQQLQLMFVLSAGSNFQVTPNQWNAGFANAASGQTDFTDSTSNFFQLTGVQLETGSVATPFERMDYGRELIMCQRYYQQWGGNTNFERIGNAYCHSSTQARADIVLVVTMRSTPTLTVSANNHWAVEIAGSAPACNNITLDQASPRIASTNLDVASGLTTGQGCHIRAENTSSARFNLSAEL
jgi:hypothetical protein